MEGRDGQYWRKPKKASAQNGEAWWYADERGRIEIYTEGNCVVINAAKLKEFLNMLTRYRSKG